MALQLGDALGCDQSALSGCGTRKSCLHCGAAQALLSGLGDMPIVQECRLTCRGEAVDFRVTATPLRAEGKRYVILVAADISSEKRRQVLENIFLHDIANTASSLASAGETLAKLAPSRCAMFVEIVSRTSHHLLNEIRAQQEVADAEKGELRVRLESFGARALLEETLSFYREQNWTAGRAIRIARISQNPKLLSDRTLLGRVLSNLLKNALEAAEPGDTVTLECVCSSERAEFRVHNPQVMPPEVQFQVFQRSFSTKGPGRGLGTYGTRLITERYLKGNLDFDSARGRGTTFRVNIPRLAHSI